MKKSIAILLLFISVAAFADEKKFNFTPARDLTLIGKATDDGPFFHRVDTARYSDMPEGVKRLFTQSAGLAIHFVTNSTEIKARWEVSERGQGANMSPIMQKGLDLYIKRDRIWQYAGVGSPRGNSTESTLVANMEEGEKECLLYLPLYDETKSLQIGVEEGSYIKKGKRPFNGKIVVYGSSITQGASASRPGMAYPSILSRKSGYQFINMGLSGRGKMEASVGRMLADIENVDAFILDCIPNPSPEEITGRMAEFIGILRAKHPEVPIIVIQSIVRETGNFNMKARETVARQNIAAAEQVKALLEAGDKNLYMIEEDDFIGTDHEGTIDGTHPNDIGFARMLEKFEPALTEILNIRFNEPGEMADPTAKDSLALVNADWKITELEKGAVAMYAQVPMFNSVQSISVVKYPAKKFSTEILHRPGDTAGKVGDIGEETGAVAGVNGCYFHVKQRYPSVYFRAGKTVYAHTHPTEVYRVDGLMALKGKKGKGLLIAKSDTTQYEQIAGKYHTVMASGPLLVKDDEIVVPVIMGNLRDGDNVAAVANEKGTKIRTHYSSAQFYDRRHPRAVIGNDEEGNVYYVVIDGRFPGKADGASIYETACICRLLGMTDALNLDGGGSSTLWSDETGVINYPYDNKKFDHEGSRTVPNLIVAY